MTEQQLVEALEEETRLLANDAVERGLDPRHIANVLLIAALKIAVQIDGLDATREGLLRAAENLGANHG